MHIEISGVSRQFGSFLALRSVDLSIASGELVALLGPSGSGKTTLLRLIAGLDRPDAGDIRFDGVSIADFSARERDVGFVFQHYALFRHMTVFENVAFGLRVRPRASRLSNVEISRRVNELLELVQIGWLAQRMPAQLSGGQRQRVALARALAIEPKVLLLDEPFGALDAKVRKELRRWLRRLHRQLGMTSVFVTHDQEEAMELADRVVVMDRGRIEQVDSPEAIYAQPATAFVSRFLGDVNELEAQLIGGRITVENLDATALPPQIRPDGAIRLHVRPQDLVVRPAKEADANGVVQFISVLGPIVRLEVELKAGRQLIEVVLPQSQFRELGIVSGQPVALSVVAAGIFSVNS